MVITSPITDFFARLKNASLARKQEIRVPYSGQKYEIAKVLAQEGYLQKVGKTAGELILELAFQGKVPRLTDVKIISRPGVRIYKKAAEIKAPLGGAGIAIVSTSQGIMTHREAKKKGAGGEVLAQVF